MNIVIQIPFLWDKPSLAIEIDASVETKFHFRAAVTKAVSNRANLIRANLIRANLIRANLIRANLYGANLTRANLYGANLDGETSLLCCGEMQRIKTMQLDCWAIGYSATHLQVGCQRHTIEKWARWDTPAGRKWIESMDGNALAWADKYLRVVLALIAVNPAT